LNYVTILTWTLLLIALKAITSWSFSNHNWFSLLILRLLLS